MTKTKNIIVMRILTQLLSALNRFTVFSLKAKIASMTMQNNIMRVLGLLTLCAIAYYLYSIDRQIRIMRYELLFVGCSNE